MGLIKPINSYWDNRFKRHAVKILPGEYYACRGDEMIVTILGSCISACIYDTVMKIGGMNHFMLPADVKHNNGNVVNIKVEDDSDAARYGNVAMERLINEIIKLGGNRAHMQVKIFGGGRITNTAADIGSKNISFVRSYLKSEGIPIVKEDVGNNYPRKVYYIPSMNDVFVKQIRKVNNETIVSSEKQYLLEMKKTETQSQVFFLD